MMNESYFPLRGKETLIGIMIKALLKITLPDNLKSLIIAMPKYVEGGIGGVINILSVMNIQMPL